MRRIVRSVFLSVDMVLWYNKYAENKWQQGLVIVLDKQLYTTKKVEQTEEHGAFVLEYYVTEDETPLGENMSVISYGIEIVMRSRTQIEACRASFLFQDKQAAENFAALLAKDSTFPVSLAGIVEDLLAGQDIPQTDSTPNVQCFTASA